jgi:hypothetical protein
MLSRPREPWAGVYCYAVNMCCYVVLCCAVPTELVEQLLDAGACVDSPANTCGLQPLHLACMPKVCSIEQVGEDTWHP